MPRDRIVPVVIRRVTDTADAPSPDVLAVEEPLAIQVAAGGRTERLGVTMRTPGNDHELAVGWLLAEGVVAARRDVLDVSHCVRDAAAPVQHHNAVTVTLAAPRLPDLSALDRHGLITSACGVCGRAAVDGLAAGGVTAISAPTRVAWDVLTSLPDRLRAVQDTFDATGGLHAAARFTTDGDLVAVREDVGRHNALDKLAGAALLDDALPWTDQVLLLSGRASYELIQKAAVVRVPVVAAIGAPSSLAVEVADAFGITLVGFLRPDRANVYTRPDRITVDVTAPGVRA